MAAVPGHLVSDMHPSSFVDVNTPSPPSSTASFNLTENRSPLVLPTGVEAPAPRNLVTVDTLKNDAELPAVFFYGSLMDPDITQMAADLQSAPKLMSASIRNFQTKMWRVFPCAISCDDVESTVSGMCFFPPSLAAIEKLQNYEGEAYVMSRCQVYIQEIGRKVNGVVFVAREGEELVNGVFSLSAWKQNSKAATVKYLGHELGRPVLPHLKHML